MTGPNLFASLVLVLVLASALAGQVTVYVSLDIEFSKDILDEFAQREGIDVVIDFDTEANKTVGMVNKIISEKENPRCDVYWNNEVGQTIRLKNLGLLQPYVSPNAASIPEAFKDPEGYWTGFAARARVIIFNEDLVGDGPVPKGLLDLLDPAWDGKVTMAKPLTGTTLTHAAALFSVWGKERARAFFEDLLRRDIFWSRGNAMCMRDVGRGAFHWGYTDTDDANVSRLKGHPTDIIVPDQGEDGMGTLVIPNSVMIIKGARNVENARKLVDYILSPEVEERLAGGRSAQIPLHPGVEAPAGVLRLEDIRAMEVDWADVGRQLEEESAWLHDLFEGDSTNAGETSRSALWILAAIVVLAGAIFLGRRSAVR